MSNELERLISIVKKLRAPDGCDWDNVQTSKSLTPYLLEEVYEVIEAIETEDIKLLKEELGDLLFTVICLARHLKIDPNAILLSANEKFKTRFQKVTSIMQERGKELVGPEEMEEIWQLAKKN